MGLMSCYDAMDPFGEAHRPSSISPLAIWPNRDIRWPWVDRNDLAGLG